MDISVVIPLYNKNDSIARSIDSIMRQELLPREVIVVDDGSTDGSGEKAASISMTGLRVVRQPNAGVSAARNRGVQEASGEWVAFLDADDEWLPGFLRTVSEMHERFPGHDLYATAYYSGDFRGKKTENVLNRIAFDGTSGVMENYFDVAASSAPPVCSSAVCVRKKRLLDIGGFPIGITAGEDLLTWARLAAGTPPVYSLAPLAVFWKEKAHTYEDRPKRVPDESDPVGKALLELKHDGSLCTPYIDRYLALWHKMRASIYLRLGMKRKAVGEVFSSLRHDPSNPRVMVYLLLCGVPEAMARRVFKQFGQ